MQSDILEDLILGKSDPFFFQSNYAEKESTPHKNSDKKQNRNLLRVNSDEKNGSSQMLSTPQRQSRIDPAIEKLRLNDEEDQIYLQSEQPESDNTTPINN